ncbi:MAG: hypothetical protein M1300_02090 [Epsilonproteobacteria bacterium]|nr:hypothetical protein [Campylobacterota bacterium]OYZ57408.1 MAG: hypothetical protein B7Y17_06405 [Sulfuricurvum sp. 24-42-5]
MRFFSILFLFSLYLCAQEINGYATVGMVSTHFKNNDGGPYNEDHKAYGAELTLDQKYTMAYLHFVNSRDKVTDIGTIGYRYDLYGPFGFYAVVGYQKGYCFEGLKSVECSEGKDNSGFAFMPMLYYKHDYFTLDLITQGTMVALKLNIKLF